MTRSLKSSDRSRTAPNAPRPREALARQADEMRQLLCEMCLQSDSGHVTSSLSAVDILTALFFRAMAPKDVFILSKGHAAPALYSAFILKEWIPRESAQHLREIDSPLQGHPDVSRLPLVQATTGALGQGLSIAMGRALAMQMKKENRFAYCLIGDGETQEGQIWESALFGGNRGVHNLIAFTDFNKIQSDGPLAKGMPLGDLKKKWESFDWYVQEVDGHNIAEILESIERAKAPGNTRPNMILAHTQKGYVARNYTILGGDHSGKMTPELMSQIKQVLDLPTPSRKG